MDMSNEELLDRNLVSFFVKAKEGLVEGRCYRLSDVGGTRGRDTKVV